MGVWEIIVLALRSIKGNLLRTSLTLMIIAIGIMALVGILTAVDGIKESLTDTFSRVGANTYEIKRAGGGIHSNNSRAKRADPITFEQATEFKKRFEYPAEISLSVSAAFMATAKHGDKKTNPNIYVRAADENYMKVAGLELATGRNLSASEVESGTNVCIIGEGIAKKLYKKLERAPGKVVNVNGQKYRVLGVIANSGSSGFFSSENMIVISVTNGRIQFPDNNRSYTITTAINETQSLELAISETMGLMRSVRKLPVHAKEDFEIVKSDKLASMFIDNLATIIIAATIIGFITLFGAAIGLMNIMLVSVAERTREIGVNKAIGAKNSTILLQFLGEAVVIGQLGGILGIILGVIVGNMVALAVNGPFIIPWNWMFMGIGFCFVVGIVSGIYPAIKASKLDPIESLRYE